MPPPDLHVSDDPAGAVAQLLADQARRGGSIVLTGGSTPGEAYEQASRLESDWHEVTLWWGDERCVPPDDENSNYGLAKRTLLDRLQRPPREVHRIRGEADPEQAAAELDAALAGAELDVMLLGLGPDGHMASLFPGSPQLQVTDRRAVSGPPGLEPWIERVTMTVPVIQAAKRIVFLVSGEAKADAVARAFGGEVTPEVPASLSRRAPVPVEVFLDPAAAAKIGA
ncbi:MAG TPA: 6-phosphogluconolactonase [Gaiellaceae bacterium]|nr:6-phosphogluconolactonase [Gaiellaceae bacterium]